MFRGEYKTKNAFGKPFLYNKSDVVVYEGRMYECQVVTDKSPLQSPNSWTFSNVFVNIISDNAPVKPIHGQVWTSSNGKTYTWYVDSNSSQWVET